MAKTRKPAQVKQPAQINESFAEKVMWWCLLLTVFLVPLAYTNLTFLQGIVPTWNIPITYDQFDIAKVFTMRALAIVGLAAWGWARLTKGGPIRRTKLDWIILAFLAWIVLTTITSIHPPTAFLGKYRRYEGLVTFFTYAAIYFLTVQTVDRPSKIRSVAKTMAVSGFIVALYGVAQYLGVDFVQWGRLPFEENRAFSTFGNPDLLGGFLMFPLPVTLALGLTEKNVRWRWFYWVSFATLVVCWIVAFTRGAWIGGVVGLGLLAVIAFRKRARLETPDKVVGGVAAVAATAVVVRSLGHENAILNVGKRIVSIFQFDAGSAKTRFEIWEAAWNATKDRPITGFGADTFRLVFPKYKPIEYVADAGYLSVADNVHNYPLQLMAAIGIPGFLLLYAIFIRALWVSARSVWSKDGGERLLLAGFWAAVAGYLVHLMFGLSVTGSSFLLWVSVGILMVASAKTVEIPSSNAVWRTVAAALIVVIALVGSYFNIRFLWADHHHLLSKIGVLTTNGRVEATKRSIELNPWNDMYRAELGLAYTDITIQRINAARSALAAGGDPRQEFQNAKAAFLLAEEAMLDTIEFVPPEYDNYVFLANLYNLAGNFFTVENGFAPGESEGYFERAVEIAEKGIEVEPFGPAIRVQIGRALISLGRYDEAIEHLSFAAEMDPRYSDARILLGRAYYLKGDRAEGAAWLLDALEIAPKSPEGLESFTALLREVEGDVAAGKEVDLKTEFLVFAGASRYVDASYKARASAMLDEALEEYPEVSAVLEQAAWLYYDSGDLEKAVEVQERVVDLAPEDRRANRTLRSWQRELEETATVE
ncbi:MAG: tetratricopeptide repeat protein [Coriobacteriia bacterium]